MNVDVVQKQIVSAYLVRGGHVQKRKVSSANTAFADFQNGYYKPHDHWPNFHLSELFLEYEMKALKVNSNLKPLVNHCSHQY